MSRTPPRYEDFIIDFKHALEESFDYPLPFLELTWYEITPWTWDDKGDAHSEEWIIEDVGGVPPSPDKKGIEEKVTTNIPNTPPTIHVDLKPRSPSPPPSFPEGGWRAWSTVLGG
jgi:hypothetical protein